MSVCPPPVIFRHLGYVSYTRIPQTGMFVAPTPSPSNALPPGVKLPAMTSQPQFQILERRTHVPHVDYPKKGCDGFLSWGEYEVCKFDRVISVLVAGLTPWTQVSNEVDTTEELVGVCWKEVGSDLLILLRIALEVYRAMQASKSSKKLKKSVAFGLLENLDRGGLEEFAANVATQSLLENDLSELLALQATYDPYEDLHPLPDRMTGDAANHIIALVAKETASDLPAKERPKIKEAAITLPDMLDYFLSMGNALAIDNFVFFTELAGLEILVDEQLSTDEVWLMEAQARLAEKEEDYWPSSVAG